MEEKIPEGWKKEKIGNLIIENPKSHFKVEDADNEGDYLFFTSGDSVLKHSCYLVDGENLFLSTGGSAYVYYYKGKASYSADTYSIKTKIDTRYTHYFILSHIDEINERFFIGSGLKHLQKNDFKEHFEILLPENPKEQQKIASILETIDNTIEKTNAIIEKYKSIKQGLMQDLLTKGITAFEFEKDKLIESVKRAFNNKDHQVGREENLVNHLSTYLRELFSDWDVDSEVEKNEKRQRPDIIIHKRNTNQNLFAIEVKKNENLNEIKKDVKKLEKLMLESYQYEDAVFIGFNIKNFEEVFKLSDKINFILVSESGEIRVKQRVRKFKNSELSRIPEEWEVVELESISFNITDGKHGDCQDEKNSGYYFISAKDIDDGKIHYDNARQITKRDFEEAHKRTKLEPFDIVLTNSGTIGKIAVVKDQPETYKTTFQKSVAIIKLNKYLTNPYFAAQKLESIIKKLVNESYGSAQQNLLLRDLRRLIIPLPSLPEQHRIAQVLSQIDEVIEKEQKYKEKLEMIKKGLMEDLLTGKVRVNHLIEGRVHNES